MLKKMLVALLVASLSMPSFAITKRSYKARADFAKTHPCPSTGKAKPFKCTGYVIDHIVPLACGGLDAPVNMQWQTIADAKAKDKVERKDCQKK